MGAGLSSLYRKIHFIEVRYIKVSQYQNFFIFLNAIILVIKMNHQRRKVKVSVKIYPYKLFQSCTNYIHTYLYTSFKKINLKAQIFYVHFLNSSGLLLLLAGPSFSHQQKLLSKVICQFWGWCK